jgi:RND family efflux transporter MFP subunit
LGDLKNDLASLRIDRKQKPPAWRRWVVLLLVLACFGSGGYTLWRVRDSLAVTEVEVVRPQVLRPGEAGSRLPILTATGYIVARKKAVVSAKIQGRLGDLKVEEGSKVAEGDVIARLESSDYEAQVERAKAGVERNEAELEESQRQLRLAEGLNKTGVESQDALDAARSKTKVAEAALKQSRADLGVFEAYYQNTFIRAPFSGVVIKKMAEVGESVAPIPPGVNVSTSSGAIVALVDMSTLEMEADVNESYISKLKPDQPAEVVVEALPDKKFKSALRQIIPSADRTKATVLVKVTLIEKDENLKPEMSAKVTFFEEEKPSAEPAGGPAEARIVIPPEAVVTRNGNSQVFEVVDGKVRLRPVVLGEKAQGRVVIQNGLGGSERLVLKPPETLQDGEPVRIIDKKP